MYLFYAPNGIPQIEPELGIALGAGSPDAEEPQHLARGARRGRYLRVDDVLFSILGNRRLDPLDDVGASLPVVEVLGRELAGQDLENYDPQTVDVALRGNLLVLHRLGRLVAEHRLCSLSGVDQRVECVVAQQWLVIVAQKYVARLEISMRQFVRGKLGMQETEPACYSSNDLQSGRPS